MTRDEASDAVRGIGSLCRGAWDEDRIEVWTTMLAKEPGLTSEGAIAAIEFLLTELEPDAIYPAAVIQRARKVRREAVALPAPDGQVAKIYHPGEGIGGARPPVVEATSWERAKARAAYARSAEQTREAIAAQGESRNRAVLRAEVEKLMGRWLRGDRRCDFCSAALRRPEDLTQYLEWATHLGRERPIGTRMPEPKVFCNACAVDAIAELIDGTPFRRSTGGNGR